MKNLIPPVLLLLITSFSFAQNTWTPEKVMQYKNITATNISPDGKYIAYVVRVPLMEGEKSEFNTQIWVAATDGSFDNQYTRGDKSSSSPQFSPDGKQLAFLSNRVGDKNQVFIMRLMGGEPEQIRTTSSPEGALRWISN